MRQVKLEFNTKEQQVESLHQIAREIQEGRAKIIAVAVDPKDTKLMTFVLEGRSEPTTH